MHACTSYYKRILDTTSRYKYIEYAYDNMRRWMKLGNEGERKLKRYIHRYLALPPTLHESTSLEDAKGILMEFAFQYVNALLRYCSDDLKEGMYQPCLATTNPHAHSMSNTHTQGISSCRSKRRSSSRKSPLARFYLTLSPVLLFIYLALLVPFHARSKVCMVYFHAIDVVLDRKNLVRKAWQARCHLPKAMFQDKKGRKGSRASAKLTNYALFKRMLAVKPAVYEQHQNMMRLYEKYCDEVSTNKYWGGDGDDECPTREVVPAEEIDEVDCDDGF